ncbi:MAG: 3-deoxy-manno-octulosonate-8-phosphatase KdsC [Gammaproteobacteria bacterium]|nr:3-deoxy-manno-octulosonate-8-phosphatase KdsC [Gammaproteobacteria bacterium]
MAEAISLPNCPGEDILALARKIKLVLFDVDGVLTDGSLFIGDDGQEYKAFNSRDGHGMKMLQKCGVAIGIITGRTSKVVEHRVNDLGIKHVYQGCADKLPVYTNLIHELKIDPEETAFVGDDVVDLPIMLRTGLAITVHDGHYLVRQHAHWATTACGGRGAAREVCEMIMYAQDKLSAELQNYL